ncbi:allophanate hydrolase-related protein, partial [Streptomyces collinus]
DAYARQDAVVGPLSVPVRCVRGRAGGTLLSSRGTGPGAEAARGSGKGDLTLAGIEGEVWRLPAAGFATFTAAVPPPMTIGTVELADGRQVSGFLVEPYAVESAPDITRFGGWRAYTASS